MPSISELTGVDLTGYSTVNTPPPSSQQQDIPLLPTRSSLLRFAAPNIPGSFPSSDTLTGYHLGGKVPQWRIPVPPTQTVSGSSTSTTTVVSNSTNTTTNNPPLAKTASITTSVLSPAGQFTGSLSVAKAFIVLSVSVNQPTRIRLYSTAMAQSTDLSRPITQGAGFGTEQGIIGDMVLTSAPTVWAAENMTGANGDSPQSTNIYITCDNLGASSSAITITVSYVPLQS